MYITNRLRLPPADDPNTDRRQSHCAGRTRRPSMRQSQLAAAIRDQRRLIGRATRVKCRPLHNTLARSCLVKAASFCMGCGNNTGFFRFSRTLHAHNRRLSLTMTTERRVSPMRYLSKASASQSRTTSTRNNSHLWAHIARLIPGRAPAVAGIIQGGISRRDKNS